MKPILFNTAMVKSVLAGQKIVTRRVIKPQPEDVVVDTIQRSPLMFWVPGKGWIKPPYQPGDILYVRETWKPIKAISYPRRCEIEYKSGGTKVFDEIISVPTPAGKWKPSIHMPQKVARLFLKVTDVKVERLQDITEEQAQKEGCNSGLLTGPCSARWQFEELWNSTIKKSDLDTYGWGANPWVWVIEFERFEN